MHLCVHRLPHVECKFKDIKTVPEETSVESQHFATEDDSFPSESSRFVASLRREPSRRNLHSCSEEQQVRAETQEDKMQRVS